MNRSSGKCAGAAVLAFAIASSVGSAVASPTILYDNPQRPMDSRKILATSGIVFRYELIVTDTLIAPRLTIKDDITGSNVTFSLSFDTSVDGRRLSCSDGDTPPSESSAPPSIFAHVLAGIVTENHLCSKLPPDVVVGKTRVVLVYWRHMNHDPPNILKDLNQNPGSDAIWVTH